MAQREPIIWLFKDLRASFFLYGVLGMIILFGIVSHDMQLLMSRDEGQIPMDPSETTYLPFTATEQAVHAFDMTVIMIFALIALAILVRTAQWHYLNHGVSVE